MKPTPSKTRAGTAALQHGRNKKLQNLVHFGGKSKENRDPRLQQQTVQFFQLSRREKKRKKLSVSTDTDDVWKPKTDFKKPKLNTDFKKPKLNTSSSVGSQTNTANFIDSHQISHSDLLNLQLDGNFSDTQMRIIARFIRKKTRSSIIEPCYEIALTRQHDIFTDIYEYSSYTPPPPPDADDDYAADSIPLVICTDTTELLRRISSSHNRTVRLVKHGVDAGNVGVLLCLFG